jgi:hypothetical protein
MEELDRRLLLGAAGLAGVAALAGRSKAGPLTPPAGAVTATAKPLTDVEPRTIVNAANTPGDATAQFIIAQSGSYALAANTVPVAGKITIKITASDVSLDLRGFTIRGSASSSDGVNAPTAGIRNLAIVNGVISGCGGSGINAAVSASSRFADLHLTDNAAGNLYPGAQAVIERVNTTGGAAGIAASDRCTISACTVRTATGTGIQAGFNCVVTGCTALLCGSHCIDVGNGSVIQNCAGSGSAAGHGIRANYAASVIDCVANSNALNGIETQQRNIVSRCLTVANLQNGIHAQFVGTVEDCFCEGNTTCGILAENGIITIRRNTCNDNGTAAGANGAGIRVAGNGNTVEGNCVAANYRGIDMIGGRNGIYTNRAWGNSNADYSMGVGNSYGPIIAALGTGDITSTANSNHPLANLRF